MFAKISNNQVIQYPAYPDSDHPNISFPREWQGGVVENDIYSFVSESDRPSCNLGWTYTELTPYYNSSTNTTIQQWSTTLQSTPDLIETITNKRYDVETGGVNIGGVVYASDRDSQAKYTGISLYAILPTTNLASLSVSWKLANGSFKTLNANEIFQVATTVMGHVQASFAQESYLLNLVAQGNTTVLEATDFSGGWPTNI